MVTKYRNIALTSADFICYSATVVKKYLHDA